MNLQNLLSEIKSKLGIEYKATYILIYTLYGRYREYGNRIGLGRYDLSNKLNISERKARKLIAFLLDKGYIIKSGQMFASNIGHKVNTYYLFDIFEDIISAVCKEARKVIKSLSDLLKDKGFTLHKNYNSYIEYNRNGIKYIVSKFGKFKNMLYDTSQNKILTFTNIYDLTN